MRRPALNVYEDLEYPDADAMLLKAGLMTHIQRTIDAKGLALDKAAQAVGVSENELADCLRGRFRAVSAETLLVYLNRLGQNIEIVVSPITQDQHEAQVTVRAGHEVAAA